MEKKKLYDHFTKGLNPNYRDYIGSEVETHFVDRNRNPITVECSQKIFKTLTGYGWTVITTKGSLITELQKEGNKMLYELGRQNIEVATYPTRPKDLQEVIQSSMTELYLASRVCCAYPLFKPIIDSTEDLLVIADERDVEWLQLDGRKHLAPLAKTASVQFTVETRGPEHAIFLLRKLASNSSQFLCRNPYDQEKIWRTYIRNSDAGYKESRYGVVIPETIEQYVDMLAEHDVVMDGRLVPFAQAEQENIDLFLRSIWWNFRLRRYNDRLCIEVRTLARRKDAQIFKDFKTLMSIIQ